MPRIKGVTRHTTVNLSTELMEEAQRLFKGKTKTELLHEGLLRLIELKKDSNLIKKWAGKGRFQKT